MFQSSLVYLLVSFLRPCLVLPSLDRSMVSTFRRLFYYSSFQLIINLCLPYLASCVRLGFTSLHFVYFESRAQLKLAQTPGGIILSGVIVRRFNLKKSCRLSAKYCVIFQFLTLWTLATFMIPGCDQVNLAGVVKPYFNSQLETRSPLAPCNTNCSCSIASINPVCGGDKLTYFSPCHAGCSKVIGSKVFNCSCIGSAVNGAQAEAMKGYCDRGPGCKNFTYFLVISFALLLAVFLTGIPNKTVVLRCVPDNQRSYSLGFQFIFQRSLGFLPGPVTFGWMFDSLCLFWGESCGKRGRCQIYDIWRLSLGITVFGSALKGMALIFYILTLWFCKSSYDEEKETEEDNPKETDALNEELLCAESVL